MIINLIQYPIIYLLLITYQYLEFYNLIILSVKSMEGEIKNKSRVEQALAQAQEVPMGVNRYSALELFKSRLQGINQLNQQKKNHNEYNNENKFSIWSDFTGIQKNQANVRDALQGKYKSVFDEYRTAIKSEIEEELQLKYRINQSYERPKENQGPESPKRNLEKNAPELHTFGKKNQNKNAGSSDFQIQDSKPNLPQQGISLEALKSKPQIDIFSRASWAQNRQVEQRPQPEFKSSNNFKLFSEDNPLSSITQKKVPNLFFNTNIQKKDEPEKNIFNQNQNKETSKQKFDEEIKAPLFMQKIPELFSKPNPDVVFENMEKKQQAKKPSFSFTKETVKIGFLDVKQAKPFNLFNNNNSFKPATSEASISQQMMKPAQEKEPASLFSSNLSKLSSKMDSQFSSSFAPNTNLTPKNSDQKIENKSSQQLQNSNIFNSDANKAAQQKSFLTPGGNSKPISFGNKFSSEGLFQKKKEQIQVVPDSPIIQSNPSESEKKQLQPAKPQFSFKPKQNQSSSGLSFFQMKPVLPNKEQEKSSLSPFTAKKQQSMTPKLQEPKGMGIKSSEELFGKPKNQSSSLTPASNLFKNPGNLSTANPFQNLSGGLTPGGSLFGNLSGGSLFGNPGSSLFGNQNKGPVFSAKPENQDDDDGDDDKEEQILKGEQQLSHDPSKSTGNYQYEQNDYLFKETAMKFKKGSGSLFQNITIIITKNEKNQFAINAVLKTSVTCFSGNYLPETSEVVVGEGSNYCVMTVKKVVTKDKDSNKISLETLKIKFQDEKVGKKFVKILRGQSPN